MSDISQNNKSQDNKPQDNKPQDKKPALAPWGVTLGLGLFALCLSSAGFGFKLLFGEPVSAVLWHALKVVPVFVVGIPALTCAVAYLMNYFAKAKIHMRNAWTLGWLLSCVFVLSKMGVYS